MPFFTPSLSNRRAISILVYEACYAHAQAPEKFYALQELVTRMRGIESGHKQAEGYIRQVQSPDFELPMDL